MYPAPRWLPPLPTEAQLSDTSDWESKAGATTTARPAVENLGKLTAP